MNVKIDSFFPKTMFLSVIRGDESPRGNVIRMMELNLREGRTSVGKLEMEEESLDLKKQGKPGENDRWMTLLESADSAER